MAFRVTFSNSQFTETRQGRQEFRGTAFILLALRVNTIFHKCYIFIHFKVTSATFFFLTVNVSTSTISGPPDSNSLHSTLPHQGCEEHH